MLSAEFLQTLPDELVKKWDKLEVELLSEIANRIKIADYITPANAWRINKLKEMGIHQSFIKKKLSEMLNVSQKEMNQIFKKAVKEGLLEDTKRLTEAQKEGLVSNITANPTVLNSILTEGVKALNGEISNYTKTYAAALSKTYENAIDKAYLNVSSGFMSKTEAVERAVKELFSASDLPILMTKDGRIEQIDTVVARAVRTGVNQSIAKMQMANLEDLGCDLVEVSSHYGARPSHAVWQGQIYSLSGKDKRYPNFKKATGFGTGEGLCGWNCRHSFYPYFEGLSTESFDKIDKKENDRIYALQQKQRALEKKLKRLKKQKKVFKAGGVNPGIIKNKIKKYNNAKLIVLKEIEELKSEKYDRHFLNIQFFGDGSQKKINNVNLLDMAKSNYDNAISFGDMDDYGVISKKLFTKEVIMTNERALHILNRHKELLDINQKDIRDLIKGPNGILEDVRNKNSYIFTKEIDDIQSLVVVIKLLDNASQFKFGKKNTIITAFKVSTLRVKKADNLLIYVDK